MRDPDVSRNVLDTPLHLTLTNETAVPAPPLMPVPTWDLSEEEAVVDLVR